MIFLSLHYGGPHASPAKRVVWGEGGTTEWSGCPPSGGRSGVEFVPTRRRRRRLKRTSANAPVLTGVWGRSATNKRVLVYTGALLAATCYRYVSMPQTSNGLYILNLLRSASMTPCRRSFPISADNPLRSTSR